MEEMNEQPVVEQEETTQAEEPTIKSEVLEDGTYRVGFPTTEETPEVTEPTVEEEPQVEEDVPTLQEVTDEPESQVAVEEEAPMVEAQPEVTPEQPRWNYQKESKSSLSLWKKLVELSRTMLD